MTTIRQRMIQYGFVSILVAVMLGTITLFPCRTYAEGSAKESVYLTHEMLGDNSETEIVRLTRRVTGIEDGAFSGLVSLKEIRVDGDNDHFASFDGCLYNKDFTVLICVPRNKATATVKGSIEEYWPHALDGLAQSRKDKLDEFLKTKNGCPAESGVTEEQKGGTDRTPVSKQTSIDFSQYVYTDIGGYVAFKYTGSGDTSIIIPEGVERIAGFCEGWTDRNYDVTYVYLPSTLKAMYVAGINCTEEKGWDMTMYNVLYQLPNLQTVEGGNHSYQASGSSVIRPGNITVWSKDEMVPYDPQVYRDYNNGKRR